MATYYVDDGGSDTAPYDTWAKAATSLTALDAAVAFAAGDIVYFGHDHVCLYTHSANLTVVGPANAHAPIYFISATQGSDPPTYQASSTNQIDTTEGTYDIIFDGSFSMHGLCIASGDEIRLDPNTAETSIANNCTFKLGAGSYLRGGSGTSKIVNCVIDLSADGTTPRTGSVFDTQSATGELFVVGATFVNAGYRTGSIFGMTGAMRANRCDFSGFTNGTLCELITINNLSGLAAFYNCKTAATWGVTIASTYPNAGIGGFYNFTNCGPADDPTFFFGGNHLGNVASYSTIYRSGGASFESINASWLVTTRATSFHPTYAFESPWINGFVASTGSKTFDIYITNDTADFTDEEVWIEVEYFGTADSQLSSLVADKKSNILASATTQADDTTSTWVGTGPAFTYKQKLSVTATVGEEGQFRARVCVGVAGIDSSRYFYIDPKVTVT